jgi:hypothetical protein
MLRRQIIGLSLILVVSGCSTLAPSTALYWESMQGPSDDIDFGEFHRSKFDREAKQLAQEGLKAGLQVHLLLVDRQNEEDRKNSEVHLQVTQYVGKVESVDRQTVVLKEAIEIIERRSMHSVPVLSKIPYASRMFRNSGVGRESRKMSEDAIIPRDKIAGAFELSASGAESLILLRKVERIGVNYVED